MLAQYLISDHLKLESLLVTCFALFFGEQWDSIQWDPLKCGIWIRHSSTCIICCYKTPQFICFMFNFMGLFQIKTLCLTVVFLIHLFRGPICPLYNSEKLKNYILHTPKNQIFSTVSSINLQIKNILDIYLFLGGPRSQTER